MPTRLNPGSSTTSGRVTERSQSLVAAGLVVREADEVRSHRLARRVDLVEQLFLPCRCIVAEQFAHAAQGRVDLREDVANGLIKSLVFGGVVTWIALYQGYDATPTIFWDVFGEKGHPVRTTISDMGPLLLSRLMDLSETQEGVLTVAFEYADDEGMLLLDLKDLRAMLNWVSDNAAELSRDYGRVSTQSVTAILRRLLVLEEAGGYRVGAGVQDKTAQHRKRDAVADHNRRPGQIIEE